MRDMRRLDVTRRRRDGPRFPVSVQALLLFLAARVFANSATRITAPPPLYMQPAWQTDAEKHKNPNFALTGQMLQPVDLVLP